MKFANLMAALAAMAAAGCTSTIEPAQTAAPGLKSAYTSVQFPYMGFGVYPKNSSVCNLFGAKGTLTGSYYVRLRTIFIDPNKRDEVKNELVDTGTAKREPLSYDKAKRTAAERLLVGESRGFTLAAKLSIDGKPPTTVPFYAVTHASTDGGETFSHDIDLMWQSPYIKVSGTGTIHTSFEGQFTNTMNTGAISAALRVAKVAVSTFNPGASILTTLNQDRLQKEGQIWDAALGRALGASASERVQATISPEQLTPDSCGILTLAVPGPEMKMWPTIDPEVLIGTWWVGADDRRLSLFTDRDLISPDQLDGGGNQTVRPTHTTPSRILAEPLGAGITVGSFLKSGKAYENLVALASNPKDDTMAQNFCRNVVAGLEELGLTTADARLGLWAAIEEMPLPGKASEVKGSLMKNCERRIAPFCFLDKC